MIVRLIFDFAMEISNKACGGESISNGPPAAGNGFVPFRPATNRYAAF